MVIHVDAKKYLDSKGNRRYIVTKIDALDKECLPELYLKGYPAAWSIDDNMGLVLNGVVDVLYVGESYDATYFEWYMKNVRFAGERLHRLNRVDDIQYRL